MIRVLKSSASDNFGWLMNYEIIMITKEILYQHDLKRGIVRVTESFH